MLIAGFAVTIVALWMPAQQTDSQAVHRSARRAQSSFEIMRRSNLPLGWAASGTSCDEHIGRFCYWTEDRDGDTTRPAEPERIRRERRRFIEKLARAAEALPDDNWIVGQHVRYLVEDGRPAEALRAAFACRATAGWCAALRGFAHHAGSDYVAADSAFGGALAAMPTQERCAWRDVSLLLEGEARKRYERLSCAERTPLEDRFWWLADPLHSLPGNDRRTEHYSRVVMDRLQHRTPSAYGLAWGDDLREMLLRFGWPSHWARTQSSAAIGSQPGIIAHDPTPSFEFAPSMRALADSAMVRDADWSIDSDRHTRTRYATPYATSFASIPHQTSIFRQGDSALVILGYDLSGDTVFARAPGQASLVVSAGPNATPVIATASDSADNPLPPRDSRERPVGVLSAIAPWDTVVVSFEAFSSEHRHIARVRETVRPPTSAGEISLSDMLLINGGDPLPTSLANAISTMLHTTEIRAGSTVGLFWQIYGLRKAGDSVSVAITISRHRDSWLRRAGESLGLAGRVTPVTLRWFEVPEPGGVANRAVTLDISALPRGAYIILLELSAGASTAATAIREIRIR